MKHVTLTSTNKFLVNTPLPYTTDVSYYGDNYEMMHQMEQFEDKVQFLYDVLNILEISKEEAIKNNYSLSPSTWMRLYYMGIEKGISKHILKLLNRLKTNNSFKK